MKLEAMAKPQAKQLVVCVDNEGYSASLEKRKIYVALRDANAEKHGLLRIVDESGDDYLYPKAFFRRFESFRARQSYQVLSGDVFRIGLGEHRVSTAWGARSTFGTWSVSQFEF